MDRRTFPLLALLVVLAAGCRDEVSVPSSEPLEPSAGVTGTSAAPGSATLPVGSPPKIAYGFAEHATFEGGDWQLVRPDGSRQPLPDNPGELVVYDERVVNGYGTEGGFVVELIDRHGRVVERADGLCAFGLATTADHAKVAWLDGNRLVTLDREGTRERSQRVDVPPIECGRLVPAAFGGYRLFVNGGRRSAPYAVAPGRPARRIDGLRLVGDVLRGKLLGPAEPRVCSALVTQRGLERWRTCRHRLLDAAPDGRHVLGIVGPSRYGRARAVSLFTRTGDLVTEWSRPAGARIEDVRWEDDSHVLAVVEDASGWSLVRLGVDGSAEYAVAPLAVTAEDNAPFRLPLS
jgi:hypothetical protein